MGVAATGLMLTSCQETQDDAPVYQKPAGFVLDTPVEAESVYELTPTGSIELTCARPDYGFVAVTNYAVEMALDKDFTESRTLEPAYPTSPRISLSSQAIAENICEMLGVTGDTYNETDNIVTLYLRATASIQQVAGSEITSNTIVLPQVQYYLAIKEPAYIYVVGAISGWKEPSEAERDHYKNYRLYEPKTAIGTKVYSGVFDVPAGQAMFRFYTALTGWSADSYGSQESDSPVDCVMTDGVYEGQLVKGQGSYNFPAWEGGEMTITVNMASDNMTVTVQAGAVDTTPKEVIYMCGNITNWAEPSEDNASKYENATLTDEKADGIYTATLTLPDSGDGKSYFRFYKALTGWGAAQWASPTGENYDLPLDEATSSAVGEGCYVLPAGTYLFTVNSNDNTVMASASQN